MDPMGNHLNFDFSSSGFLLFFLFFGLDLDPYLVQKYRGHFLRIFAVLVVGVPGYPLVKLTGRNGKLTFLLIGDTSEQWWISHCKRLVFRGVRFGHIFFFPCDISLLRKPKGSPE